MDDVHLSTARHFRYDLRLPAENFQQQFEAREVGHASQLSRLYTYRLKLTGSRQVN